ncbi:hypothetical protein [Pajaroellobacter abortibovis]|uniref:Uncharacterized protein n=1 Tax=Pajaroellobacter abortibovis TaxID=1882918 RepID=A0A1L6MZB8_9BACT|nr:hypothetical protein [Pajaroellobacter abortibovis]APS00775.1 hypothetical protein BCY86_08865 [Pajaroellobacter abortibovis]
MDFQHEVTYALPRALQLQMAHQWLFSNWVSKEGQNRVFEELDASRSGRPIPVPSEIMFPSILDRCSEFDAAGALFVLFHYIKADNRKVLPMNLFQGISGVLLLWYQDILYPDAFLKLPEKLRTNMLLNVGVKGLVG